MIDGPGPPGTDTVAVRVLPASVALITSGSGATSGILDTQRILLFLSRSGGERSASRAAHKIATMLPASPITYGIARFAGWNPDRAHTGSGLTGGCPAHPSEAATSAGAAPARAAGPSGRDEGRLLPVHAATSKAATASGT
jgi:hypothetical protein